VLVVHDSHDAAPPPEPELNVPPAVKAIHQATRMLISEYRIRALIGFI